MIHLALLLVLGGTGLVPSAECRIPFVLRDTEGFRIVFEELSEGEARAFVRTPESEFVGPLLAVGIGVSTDLKRAGGPELVTLECVGDEVRVTVRARDGSGAARELDPVPAVIFETHAIRVSVVDHQGAGAVFLVEDGRVVEGAGPPLNILQGRVPMLPGDVAITLEVSQSKVGQATRISGSVPVSAVGPYPAAFVTIPGGGEGLFILDLGATRSVVSRKLLPPGIETTAVHAVEHSASGARVLKGHTQGAGGRTEGVTRLARLPALELGEVNVDDVEVLVLEDGFLVDDLQLDGVIGLDILRRAGRIRGSLGRPDGQSVLELGGERLESREEIPISEARGLLFIEGRIGNVPLLLLLDTGARLSLVAEALAEQEDWELSPAIADTVRGLDRRPMPVRRIDTPPVALEGGTIPVAFYAGDIPILGALGISRDIGILGQPFWRDVGEVEVDFERRVLRLGQWPSHRGSGGAAPAGLTSRCEVLRHAIGYRTPTLRANWAKRGSSHRDSYPGSRCT